MTGGDPIIRIAAKGEGVSATGKHVAGAVPGDVLTADGALQAGPHRAAPPCRHFPDCGGCQLQHADEAALTRFVEDRVLNAAAGQGLSPRMVLPAHLSPPASRRRATLHAERRNGRVHLGFRRAGSHAIVDMRECHVLRPELFACVAPVRIALGEIGLPHAVDVGLSLTPLGVDCLIKGLALRTLAAREVLAALASKVRFARLTVSDGADIDVLWEPHPVTVAFAGNAVALPIGGFLQATEDGERMLQDDVVRFAGAATRVADLFAGLGTLSLPLAARGKRVWAVEADRDAYLRCHAALAPLKGAASHRDLFRNPVRADELRGFEAVVLDPPRAGARAQVEQLAASDVRRVIYVSCNPSSWARDARMLSEGGFALDELRPIGQFRWSTHVELSSVFVR